MRISINWLKEYIDINQTPEKIGDILTSLGLEAEGMETLEAVKGGLKGVVVGHVQKVWPHPNADRLRITQVDVSGTELLQIVCGAPNVAEGQKVLVAMEGCTLYPTGAEPLTIKKGKIRGELSQGMICAEDELGLGTSHDGIMILDERAPTGSAAADFLKLTSDQIIEIGLTPNRADATNHIGVAKDILAWLRLHYNPQTNLKEIALADVNEIVQSTPEFKIKIDAPNQCPRYAGVIIKNIKIGPSPEWLQSRIISMGHKPVNNVVDITNFILFEMGQPLHAFDLKSLPGGVLVQSAQEGQKFITLDGVERSLLKDDLLICNHEGKALCMAGVLGGLESGVTEHTNSIFLESAHFNPSCIRKTSTKHLIFSQAAKIFEKGSDPNLCITALQRAVLLIEQLTGGKMEGPYFDHYPEPILPAQIKISLQEISSLTGIELDETKLKQIFYALGMEFTDHRDGTFLVEIPTSKPDVKRPADLIEEIARVYGLDHIPVPSKIQISFPKNVKSAYPLRKKTGDWLAANGLNETMTVSLASSALALKTGFWKSEELVYIHNTSNSSLDIMKPSVVFNGLENIQFNQNRQQSDLSFFEFAKEYTIKDGKIKEVPKLSIFLSGFSDSASWLKPNQEVYNYYHLKSLVQGLFEYLGIASSLKTDDLKTDDQGIWEFGQSWGKLAKAGLVSNSMAKLFDHKKPIWYAEINMDALLQKLNTKPSVFKEISKFPSSSRDLAVIIPEQVNYQIIKDLALKNLGKNLSSVQLFDVYRNDEHLGAGNKSYALHFEFSSTESPISSKELDLLMQQCMASLEKECGAQVRK